MIEDTYQAAVERVGQSYLDAERALLAQGPAAVPFLQAQLEQASGTPALVARALLERIAGNADSQAALDFLREMQESAARSVMGEVPPAYVAAFLEREFGDRVAALLGVHLVKLGHLWPRWMIVGVLAYLGGLNSTAAAEPLIQFIGAASSDYYRSIAAHSLVAVGDPDVLQRLANLTHLSEPARLTFQQAADQIRQKPEA